MRLASFISLVVVLGHLVGQTTGPGIYKQCHYDSINGPFTITIFEYQGCPLMKEIDIDEQ